MPPSGKFLLFCCLFAGLFKPTAYVQFDLDQFHWNGALHVARVPTGRVQVISDEVRTLQCSLSAESLAAGQDGIFA